MRLLSYNVRYFGHALKGLASTRASKQEIAERMTELNPIPAVICLQEVETISIRSSIAYRRATAKETQLESFMSQMEQAFRRAGMGFPYQAYYFRAHTYR
ncbi:MAG TPA: endonuclease, partial [Myxococcaceae bacterium]|nr:endonuclease [Myxococcaceae bacterium]